MNEGCAAAPNPASVSACPPAPAPAPSATSATSAAASAADPLSRRLASDDQIRLGAHPSGPPPPTRHDHPDHPQHHKHELSSDRSFDVRPPASARRDSAAARTAQLASARARVHLKLRHFADFPVAGIDFVDIMPIFADPDTHNALLHALEVLVRSVYTARPPAVIVGLDARGFLFAPALALRLGVSFVPVRKRGKLPGPCATASYQKEYGLDQFQMQQDAIAPGQNVLVVDDILATGGSATAAADLVHQLAGSVVGFLFLLEIPGLNGRAKLSSASPTTLLFET